MSAFELKTNNLKQQISTLEKSAGLLYQNSREVLQIKSNLGILSGINQTVVKSLQNISTSLTDESHAFTSLATNLINVAQKYAETEKKLVESAGILETTINANKVGSVLGGSGAKSGSTLQDYAGTNATAVSADKVKSKNKKNFFEKAFEYGKGALKIGKGIVKIFGAVGAAATGAGIPVAIVSAISAGNDIINGITDVALVHEGLYDYVGKNNYLKDKLTEGGKQIGSLLGNEKAGELLGKTVYYGVDVVTFLDGVDKMMDKLGKANTIITRSAKTSPYLWGETQWSDILDNEMKFDLKTDYFVRKLLKIDPASGLNILYEAGKSVYSSLDDAKDLGKNLAELRK